jgi:hypothetical protein
MVDSWFDISSPSSFFHYLNAPWIFTHELLFRLIAHEANPSRDVSPNLQRFENDRNCLRIKTINSLVIIPLFRKLSAAGCAWSFGILAKSVRSWIKDSWLARFH